MKLKQYLTSILSRRKSTNGNKSYKSKSHQQSISVNDGHCDLNTYEDINKDFMSDYPSRMQVLLSRHAQLVDTIVGTRSHDYSYSPCSNCCLKHSTQHEHCIHDSNLIENRTLATKNQNHQISSSNNSLCTTTTTTTTRKRTKIRTNPWIKMNEQSQVEYSRSNSTPTSELTHSKSFPQAMSNGIMLATKSSMNIIHKSDSGQGFSYSDSNPIDLSSTDNTSTDDQLLYEKKNSTKPSQPRYQRLSHARILNPKKSYVNHTRSSSTHFHNRNYPIEIEKPIEKNSIDKQQNSIGKSPFILPLDETDVKLATALKRTNSRNILQHIEEIENEIRLIKTLNSNYNRQLFSFDTHSNCNQRKLICQQVDRWVDECLTKNSLHMKSDDINSNFKRQPELMTPFYLSLAPTTKRTFSFADQQLHQLEFRTNLNNIKSIRECPF